jgi:ATP/maltotriose-dependent transcriptional regulator MalT
MAFGVLAVQCLECGRDFINLANHVRQTHNLMPDDYRRKHNIPLTRVLIDESLREHLSSKAQLRMMTDEGVNHIRTILSLCDRQKQTGKKRNLPTCSVEHCHDKNNKKSLTFREKKLPGVLVDWNNGVSNRDIALKHNVSTHVLIKWKLQGYLPKRILRYEIDESAQL